MSFFANVDKSDSKSLIPEFISKNYLFYFTIFSIFIVLKFVFSKSNSLIFLISPIDKMVGIATNSNSTFIPPGGYYHEKLNIIIDKSCSGFNFWLICFLVLSFLISRYIKNRLYCLAALPALLFISYALAILINSLRIIYFVNTQGLRQIFNLSRFSWLHQAEGTLIYLSSLIIIYMIFNYLLNKFRGEHNAKLA